MRKVGTLPTELLATGFQAYLRSQAIANDVQSGTGGWDVWVHDEAHVPAAKASLAEYSANPNAAQFVKLPVPVAVEPAKPAVQQKSRRPARPTTTGELYVTFALVMASCMLTLVTHFGETREGLLHDISISRYIRRPAEILPREIWRGQLWRLWTPIFLHLSVPHLVFNMLMLFRLGGQIELLRGHRRLLGLVLITGAVSNWAQYFVVDGQFGGMSGVLYGLFGYLWVRARSFSGDGYWMDQNTVVASIAWLFICMSGAVGPIANIAHVSGLLCGAALGALPLLWRSRS